jgi:magnesium chelatase subunit H
MVNERVGSGDWEEADELGDTWVSRNSFAYGREGRESAAGGGDGAGGARPGGAVGTSRPTVLEKLLATTDRVVQEIDSVEYGLTDITGARAPPAPASVIHVLTFLGIPLRLSICRAAEYFANTGALKKAVEKRNLRANGRVAVSIVEAFGGDDVPPRDLEATLRLEYRSKLLNPKWAQAMVAQGAGGAFEVSQRMTAMVGWAATAEVDKFVFDGAAERYALDPEMAAALRRSNPEAFKNVLRRLLQNRFVTNRH